MNFDFKYVNNYLLIANEDEQCTDKLIQLCLDRIRNGEFVLMIENASRDLAKYFINENIHKELLERFVIINCNQIVDSTKKLLELHNWVILPSFIVLDLRHFIINNKEICKITNSTAEDTRRPLLQKVVLCIASFLNFMESVEQRHKELMQENNKKLNICGLVVLAESSEIPIDLLTDLYFYNDNAFTDLTKLEEKVRLIDEV